MNATATTGIWDEKLSDDVTMIFNTTRDPQRITISHREFGPVHLDYDEGIGEPQILKARSMAKEAYHIL